MPTVTVTALKAFPLHGRTVRPGDPVELEPVDAAIKSRQGLVSLAKRTYQTQALPAAKPKRRYRRRDMRAETE